MTASPGIILWLSTAAIAASSLSKWARAQNSLVHFFGTALVLDDCAAGRKVAAQNRDCAVATDWRVKAADDVGALQARFLQICVTSFVIAAFLEFFEVLAQRFFLLRSLRRGGACV